MTEILSFGEWVKRRRKALDLTQDDLAARAGCSKELIAKIEGDARRPSKQIAALLAAALELRPAERDAFVRAARAELATDRLPAPSQSVRRPVLIDGPPQAQQPSGTVLLLFTDIAGSTRLWEDAPAAMRPALARHDAILRDTVAAHGGQVFKTIGDGFCTVFLDAPAALSAALAMQRALAGAPWGADGLTQPLRVRIAVHAGTAELRDGDYCGPALNRVARLLVAGHGGQVLVSAAAHELLADHLPLEVTLRDLGRHRLKDLSRPEQIFQVVAPGLAADFPALRTLDARLGNLPAPATALIGRAQEQAELAALLAQPHVRLVTLTGPGGTGKTRLALQVAADLNQRYADGAWFVDLALVTDPAAVAATISRALDVPEMADRPAAERVLAFLQARHMLLVLDNFEQVLDAADLVAAIIAGAARVQVLATSRAPLQLYGEREVAVQPLALPARRQLAPEALSQYDAVRLFIERARAARADFTVTDASAPAVAEICWRTDGLPLAVELAAARIKLYTPEALLARLEADGGLPLLTGGARNLPARQQTIRATIAWSYDLLSDAEQILFARLGVFRGGWTHATAAAVCAGTRLDARAIPDLLESLAGHNLVKMAEGWDGEPRFTMLEMVREFARERLVQQGALFDLQVAHATSFVALAEAAEPKLRSAEQLAWLDRIAAEHENMQAVLAWCAGAPAQHPLGLHLATTLWYFWFLRGYFGEIQRWLEAPWCSDPAIAPGVRARAYLAAAFSAILTGLLNHARPLLATGQALAEQADDQPMLVLAAAMRTSLAPTIGEQLAIRTLALLRAEQAGDPWLCALAWTGVQDDDWMETHGEQAAQAVATGLRLARATGDRWLTAHALWLNGRVAVRRYDLDVVRATQREGIALREQLGDLLGIGYHVIDLALAAYLDGAIDEERSYWEEQLRINELLVNPVGVANSLTTLAGCALRQDAYALAQEQLARGLAIFEALGEERRGIGSYYLLAQHRLWTGAFADALAVCDVLDRFAAQWADEPVAMEARFYRALIALAHGDGAVAQDHMAAVQAYRQQHDTALVQALSSTYVSEIALLCGDRDRAAAGLQLALAQLHRLRHPRVEFDHADRIGWILLRSGDCAASRTLFQRALPFLRTVHARRRIARCVEGIAYMAQHEGEHSSAVRLWGAAAALRERIGAPMWPVDQPDYEGAAAAARAALGDPTFDAFWQSGRELAWEQAVDGALAVADQLACRAT